MRRIPIAELPVMQDSVSPQSTPTNPSQSAVHEREEGMRLSEVILRSLPLLGFIVIALVLVQLRNPDSLTITSLLILEVAFFIFSILIWIPKSQSKSRQ